MNINILCFGHHGKLAKLRKELFQLTENEAQLSAFLEKHVDTTICFGMWDDKDELVGYAIGRLSKSEGDTFHIIEGGMKEEVRHKGWGKRAMAVIEDVCRQRGVKCIKLITATANLEARKLYDKCGFDDAGLINGWFPNGELGIWMQKIL